MSKTMYRSAVRAIMIECPEVDGEARAELLSASGSVDDCELCGSHGSVEVDVRCECGAVHTIELEGW